nr:unnamed protein product [Digitaria exilis]
MIKNYFNFVLALVMFMQHDWAYGASRTREYSFPNLVYSPSLPPYKDVIGGGGAPSSPTSDGGVPPPPSPYCLYPPPPAKPALPAPLPPEASPPGEAPQPGGSPSISPGIITSPPSGASPPAGSPPPSTAQGSSSPPQPAFLPPVAFPTPPPPVQQAAARPGMWCVANPKAASAAVMQTAMDYACGSGADCGAAAPDGPCYLPDTLTSHASYAFNSYWQRTKDAGGTCDFAGTAMVVTRDPSYDGCRYVSM